MTVLQLVVPGNLTGIQYTVQIGAVLGASAMEGRIAASFVGRLDGGYRGFRA